MKTRIAFILPALLSSAALHSAELSPLFKHQTIDDQIGVGYGLAVADVNGDKKTDILLVDKDEVAWYENPSWQKHVISGALTERDHVCIAADDIDGDGKAEIAIGAGWNPGDTVNSGAVFYLIPPEDRTGEWEAVQLHHEPTVHRMSWIRAGEPRKSLAVLPLHGRGNRGGRGDGVKLLEYIVPEDPAGEWETRLMDDSMHMTHNFDPVQWDDDREDEVLYAGKEAVVLLNKEGEWRSRRLIDSEKNPGFPGAGEVRAGMLGSRIIATIEPMHGNNAVVYTQEGSGWKRQVLDDSLADGHAVACADFLGRGFDQILIGWRGKDASGTTGIKLFEPKSAEGKEWTMHRIDDNGMACEDLKVADFNGDGRPDIAAAGRASKNVKIYWNTGE